MKINKRIRRLLSQRLNELLDEVQLKPEIIVLKLTVEDKDGMAQGKEWVLDKRRGTK